MRILITPRSMTAAGLDAVTDLAPLRAAGHELVSGPAGRLPSEDELIELVIDIDGWLAGVETISARVLDAAPRLRVISRNGVGADGVDAVAAKAHGVSIQLARGANSRGVAELALALILNGLRDVPSSNASLKAGRWSRSLGRELPETTVGLVGFGAVGRLLASMTSALGARVLAFDPFATVESQSGAEARDLDAIFAESDVVSLHSPPPADGSALVTGGRLALMRPGGILINTARSALVDDAAVLDALDSERLSAYAVDAFNTEPPELTPLLLHERTILTPHLGGYTGASVRRATQQSVANLLATLDA